MQTSRWPIIGFFVYNGVLGALLLFQFMSAYQFIVAIYLELWVIGAFTLLKLLVVSLFGDPFSTDRIAASRGSTLLLSFILCAFFIGKFGLLLLGLGVLLIFLPEAIDVRVHLADLSLWVRWGLALMLASHAVTFAYTFLLRREFQNTLLIRLVFTPYLRSVWLVFAIMSALALASYYEDHSALLFSAGILSMKVLLDLIGLLLEVRQPRS